ncbi:crossover junction endonuclease EME1-like isoform X1 [Hordeum vulgare subsp. vulgare]|uniref:ERCC4 domain-containing protein n=1 Tax=Hordeum vulgare subsp. vulgare TaxID=112509 RepID=A0A8I6WWT5_HORVV|nr:crossover junction endonuclease EME1-like isoform X1 [Hordeum vulgare subsp. vulgare]
MAPQAPVVEIIDDDDDDDESMPASPPTLLSGRRCRATPTTAAADDYPDYLGAFSPSPPASKRRATPSTAAVPDLDSADWLAAFTPSPAVPKRRVIPSTAAGPDYLDFLDAFTPSPAVPKRGAPASAAPILLDDDTPPLPKRRPSPTPMLLLDDTPPSPFVPEIPDIAVAATPPAYATPRSSGRPSSVPGPSSTGRRHDSSGASCPISLDSDDELDDFGTLDPLAKLILPGGNSSSQEEVDHNMVENAQPINERTVKQGRKRLNKEEKDKMVEEKKRQREEKRKQKEADKIKQAEQKKLTKEKADCGSGKRALESTIVAKIDPKVIETGSIAGALLTMFSEKKLTYQIERNPMSGSILWKMVSQSDQEPALEPYILFVLQAEEFCDLISSGKFLDHVLEARNRYPTFTICYVTHKLTKYIYDREQSQYKNSDSSSRWTRPRVEQVLCKLVTHYDRVHSKDCANGDQLAEHVVGLTTSLAKCKFRKPLSWLSVHANGVTIPTSFVDKGQLKKDAWFMSLLAIPKVQPRFALAIWKKYSTMKSLLKVYMDPNKSNREKELLLQDLKCEDSLGEESRKVGSVCSRRVYRMLMAENGEMEAEEAVKS